MTSFAPAIYWTSRQGARSVNEDRVAYSYAQGAELLLLADGMGGYRDGDQAAETAIQVIQHHIHTHSIPHQEKQQQQFLTHAVRCAHHAIVERYAQKPVSTRPATTIVLALIYNNHLLSAHAGDSRLYLIRQQDVIYETKDHTFPTDASSMRTHRVYSCLGKHDHYVLDTSPAIPLQAEDIIFLCSDGVWDGLTHQHIRTSFHYNIVDSAEKLLNEAENRAADCADNMSIILRYWSPENDLSLTLDEDDMTIE